MFLMYFDVFDIMHTTSGKKRENDGLTYDHVDMIANDCVNILYMYVW